MAKQKELLTNSRMACHKRCRKQHFLTYQVGVRRKTSAAPLRMGTAGHAGLEQLGQGNGLDAALEAVRKCYVDRPEMFDELLWAYEEATVLCLVTGYEWRWRDEPIEYLANEQVFKMPLTNPATGRPTPHFDLSGKVDHIIRKDGRGMVMETKFLNEDIGDDSMLFRRLRMDCQISLYTIAARNMGHEIDAVYYNLVRKPSIRPTQVPLLDGEGFKIVEDADGNRVFNKPLKDGTTKPRQTADTELGYKLLSRPMTPDEWSEKLMADIAENYERYYNRREIARLDKSLNDYLYETWEVQKDVRACQKTGKWFRSIDKNNCQFCPVLTLCENDWQPGDSLPEEYEIVDDVHQELILTEAST